jgi:predicted ArsR family transcriptional regulator
VSRPRWEAVGALVDTVRRSLFDYVRRQDHPVTREEAADAQGVSRNLAAFHLDKLVEVGLLQARYEAPADQPRGRGRTPKVYQPSGDGLTLTVPERRYELVAEILADAVAEQPGRAAEAAHEGAARRGSALGQHLASHLPPDVDTAAEVAVTCVALEDLGFEPRSESARLILRNCPFHALAQRQRDLVCGISHSFVSGFLRGLGAEHLTAHLAPREDACCVEVSIVDGPDPARPD